MRSISKEADPQKDRRKYDRERKKAKWKKQKKQAQIRN